MKLSSASAVSDIASRKLINGVGINDADYITQQYVNGKLETCPIYQKWKDMIRRCYSARCQLTNPTYKLCSVCDDWLTFSNFRNWVLKQDWIGKEIDKDLLKQGNKVYSPDLCVFVSRRVNSLIIDRRLGRGSLMLGVSFNSGSYMSRCNDGSGKVKYLGRFETEIAAHNKYKEFKYSVIAGVASKEIEPIKSALLRYYIPKY